MSSGPEHKAWAAFACAVMHTVNPVNDSSVDRLTKMAVGAGVGYVAGGLPDVLEPALHPNHRKFFHSLAFASMVGYGGYRLYQWETETFWQSIMKVAGLSACGAYLVHLFMDSRTPKGLPLI